MNLEATILIYGHQLRRKRNVTCVYEGHKITGGQDTGRPAIVVGVAKKLPLPQLRNVDIIPRETGGHETDVVETGIIRFSNAEPDRKAKHRPAFGGISIGHPDVTAGTLGMVVRKNGERYILSNNHVLANVNQGQIGDPIYQPGVYDGGGPDDEIGLLHEFIPIRITGDDSFCPFARFLARTASLFAEFIGSGTRLKAIDIEAQNNLVDCALVKPGRDEDVLDEILGFGVPAGIQWTAFVGQRGKKSGRTTAISHNTITGINALVNVNMGNSRVAVFEDQLLTGPMSQGGDSGSILLTEDDKVLGLLFAGSPNTTVFNLFSNVISELDLET